jgi:soluble lytic murein transglycosylase-like protein
MAVTMHANRDDAGTICRDNPENDKEDAVVTEQWAQPGYFKIVRDASMKHALDPKLIATIIFVESGGNHTAVSPRGAKGLMQLIPAVYRQYGVDDPFDIEQNIHVGTAYFAYLLDKFDGNLAHALAAYNCGPTRVVEHKGIPPIRETRDYVKRVLDFYQKKDFPAGPSSRKS